MLCGIPQFSSLFHQPLYCCFFQRKQRQKIKVSVGLNSSRPLNDQCSSHPQCLQQSTAMPLVWIPAVLLQHCGNRTLRWTDRWKENAEGAPCNDSSQSLCWNHTDCHTHSDSLGEKALTTMLLQMCNPKISVWEPPLSLLFLHNYSTSSQQLCAIFFFFFFKCFCAGKCSPRTCKKLLHVPLSGF